MKKIPIKKQLDIDALFDIWLLWSVGKYANGFPLIELRGVYTTEPKAKIGEKIAMEWSNKQSALSGKVEICNRTFIEKRSINHTYAVQMRLLDHLS